MYENQNIQPQSNPEQFGMTESEYKRERINSIWKTIKYFFLKIEPTFVKIFNAAFYYTLKFIKAFVKNVYEMIRGI